MKSWQYIAGFWDGEGTIGIVRQNRRNGNFYPRVHVSNTNRRVLAEIRKRTGGTIHPVNQNAPKHWKIEYRLLIPTASIPTVLRGMLPYLTIKRSQAILLLRALKEGVTYPRYLRMRKLNKKGR